jgi:Spy/CpxP family protein refolding chaperone
MNKNTFVKRVVVAGGFLFLCAAPRLALGQPSPTSAAQFPLIKPTPTPPQQRRTYISPTEYLTGLMLTCDQKAKINQVREDTRSHLAAVAKDQKLGPEVKDAMLGGYERIQNSKIFEVLTPEQQGEVRRRIATLRAAARKPQNPSEQPPGPERNPQSK